jgi:UDP-N-acetylmuramoylalanine--D-glutamate ligase
VRRDSWLVVGLGLSGYWSARLIAEKESPKSLTVCEGAPDSQKRARADELKAICNERGIGFEVVWAPKPLKRSGWSRVVISPGVPYDLPWLQQARSHGTEVIGEIELGFRHISQPIVAVTGTNGKTTTTALIAHMLNGLGVKAWVGGNIGDPLSHFAISGEEADWVVLEVSSFQLETIVRFHPKIALILNLREDHLDRYPSMKEYAAAKANILNNMGVGDTVIVNMDDPGVLSMVNPSAQFDLLGFSTEGSCERVLGIEEDMLVLGDRPLGTTKGFTLQERANLPNIMAAILALHAVGMEAAKALETIKGFSWPSHRMEEVLLANGVTFVDDSKATNPAAVEHALGCSEPPVILLLGGRNKGFRFGSLEPLLEKKVRKTILFGEAAKEISSDLSGVEKETCATMEEAVGRAVEEANPGDTVLLSPGCASFDQFESYAQRGEVFKRLVRELVAQ